MITVVLALALAQPAATANDIIATVDASITDEERSEPGSTVRPEALAAALEAAKDLPAGDRRLLGLALAEAWLDAERPQRALDQVQALAVPEADPVFERTLLARIAAARVHLRRGEADDARAVLVALPAQLPPRAAAHRLVAEAELQLVGIPSTGTTPEVATAILASLDRALAQLKSEPAAERIPVYLLRLTAMERTGAKPDEVQAWLDQQRDDPATADLATSATTALGRLIGQAAPALKGTRRDAAGGDFDLVRLKGKPVLIDFFATWCQPCRDLAPTIAAFAHAHPDLQVVSVSLDTKDSLAQLPAFLAQHAMSWPVVGDGQGWDSEIDDAWHVDSIPCLILVDAQGRVLATDLAGPSPDETRQRLDEAWKRAAPAARPGVDAMP